jgi:uncharacterized protein (DUF849 family)
MSKVILTCAITGAGEIKSPHVPVTPQQIATSAIEAAEAGATVVHLHVRDPETGKPSMDIDLYTEVVDRIRASRTDVVLNLTGGAGARFIPDGVSANGAPGSSLTSPERRVEHIARLRPEIATLDVATLNMGEHAVINVPSHLREMARLIRKAGARPELEIFDSGGIYLSNRLISEGLVDTPALFQMVLGVPWGAAANPDTLLYLARQLPAGCHWAAFGISRMEYPMLAQALLLGGHVRVGMEDNVYLDKGVLARDNAQLVEKAVRLMRILGFEVASPDEARALLKLGNHPGIRQAG